MLQGKKDALLRQLTTKFGPLPETASRVRAIESPKKLERYLDRVIVAARLRIWAFETERSTPPFELVQEIRETGYSRLRRGADSVGRGPRDVHSSVAWPRYLGGAARSAHPSITRQHTVYFRYNYGYTDKMKTAISIPDPLFDAADEVADRLGMSRSQLYAKAVAEYVEKHRNDQVTEALNQVYAKYSSTLDPVLAAMQSMSLPREEW